MIALFLTPLATTPARGEIVSKLPCAPTSVHLREFNALVGAGNVNDLFWIRNVSTATCSLRGYGRVSFLGSYGVLAARDGSRRLAVQQRDTLSGGANGNDVGGVKAGRALSTVTLKPGGFASFWIYGTDESGHLKNGRLTRCITSYKMLVTLPGSAAPVAVSALKDNGFYWCGGIAVHPFVGGESGSAPARPLSAYFGSPSS